MEKVNLWDHGVDSWVGFFILESMSKVADADNPMFKEKYDPANMEAKLIVNGVELPLVETFKFIGSQLEKMVEKGAIKLVNEKLDAEFMQSLHKISRLTNELEEELESKVSKMMSL